MLGADSNYVHQGRLDGDATCCCGGSAADVVRENENQYLGAAAMA